MAENEQQVVVLNATIYPWQREALVRRQREMGVYSLSEALRQVLSEVLERPAAVAMPEMLAEVSE